MNVLHAMQPEAFKQPCFAPRPLSFKEALFRDDQPCVVVSAMEPHEVEHASSAFCALYGLEEAEIEGRTLRMVHGARTNLPLFAQKLKDATKGQQADGLFHCYTKDCREIFCQLQAVPVVGHCGQITHVLATLAPVRDVEVAQDVAPAIEEEFWSPVEMFGNSSAKQKDVFENKHKDMFHHDDGFSATDVLFNAKDTPKTPKSTGVSNLAMFEDDADAGFSAQDIFFSAKDKPAGHLPKTAEDKIADAYQQYSMPSMPLTEKVTQMSNFKPWPEMFTSLDDTVDAQAVVAQPPAVSVSVPALKPQSVAISQPTMPMVTPVPAPSFAQPVAFQEQAPISKEGDGQTLRLFRRKKHTADASANELAGPVDISLKMLREMSDLSLKEASQKLGLSTSAMKKACRKLGVERWPIQGQKTPVIQYNSAYVRRLYCKYAKNEDAKKGRGSMPSTQDGAGSDLAGCFSMMPSTDQQTFVRAPSGSDCFGDGNQFFSFAGAESRAPALEQGSWDFFPGSMEQLL